MNRLNYQPISLIDFTHKMRSKNIVWWVLGTFNNELRGTAIMTDQFSLPSQVFGRWTRCNINFAKNQLVLTSSRALNYGLSLARNHIKAFFWQFLKKKYFYLQKVLSLKIRSSKLFAQSEKSLRAKNSLRAKIRLKRKKRRASSLRSKNFQFASLRFRLEKFQNFRFRFAFALDFFEPFAFASLSLWIFFNSSLSLRFRFRFSGEIYIPVYIDF